ncbi:MAG: AzlD domain-containing protein [Pseudoclavibacter sp.]|nr:AzlD domain-containing protein [Pseudoclavibacter sp.]
MTEPAAPPVWCLPATMAVCFAVTFALRALPFTVLKPLRESRFLPAVSRWTPAGILAILTTTTFADALGPARGRLLPACCALAATVAAHLLLGRRTLLSVGLGTFVFVLLVNLSP